MTNEELDQARADEAKRQWRVHDSPHGLAFIAARLAREGWTPSPKPVDPDVLVVREVLAGYWSDSTRTADHYRQGVHDGEAGFQQALSAYRAEIKRQQEAGA